MARSRSRTLMLIAVIIRLAAGLDTVACVDWLILLSSILLRVVLHGADAIAFGIVEVNEIADGLDTHLLHGDASARWLDPARDVVDGIDADRAFEGAVARACQLLAAPLQCAAHACTMDQIESRWPPILERPTEHGLVEFARA